MKRLLFFILVTLITSTASANSIGGVHESFDSYKGTPKSVYAYNKLLAVDLLSSGLGNGNIDIINVVVGDEYIQHNPTLQDGKDALIDLAKLLSEDGNQTHFTANFKRIVAEDDLVALHYHAPDFGVGPGNPQGSAIVDIFRVEDGRIVEHWDVIQSVVSETANGNTMFDGAGNPYAPVKRRDLNSQKQSVKRFYEAMNDGDFEVFRKLIGKEYKQHNPILPNGVDALIGLFSPIGPIDADVKRIIAQGDLVFAHVHYVTFNQAGVDIFRFKDGKIVEHWDVLQLIPDDPVNDNGMF